MTVSEATTPQPLSLPEELILMLLNEETGYFHQVPGWDMNCAFGAVLAELSLIARIDTGEKSLLLLDQTETDNPALDPILKEIAAEPVQRNTRYWIERLASQAESIIDSTRDRLVELKVLQYHDGNFWTLARSTAQTALLNSSPEGSGIEFVKTRISKAIFDREIPAPRGVIIIYLINTCDVFPFMFQLDDEVEERIDFICKMDLIGRSMAAAVSHNLAGPLLRRSVLTKDIPTVSLRKLVLNRHIRDGNVPALFADLAQQYGPVFQISPPFAKPMVFLAGPETNRWVHRGGMYLRAKDYGQLDQLYHYARKYMADWKVGDSYPATSMCRRMINAQISPLSVSVDFHDIIDDLIKYKERALNVHIVKILPKFMLKTPNMKRRAKAVDTLLERIQSVHTPAQRAGSPRDLADDILSLHASDPQFVPESNLRFARSAALIASVYLGDAFSFALYAMASQPEIYARIQSEADALFENGDPDGEDFTPASFDVTHRFLMECLRLYPIVPMSMRTVMNSCVVEDYELPVGSRVGSGTPSLQLQSRAPRSLRMSLRLPRGRSGCRSALYPKRTRPPAPTPCPPFAMR